MKILFANEYAYPNVVSGAEFSMEALATALAKAGQKIIIISPSLDKDLKKFTHNRINYEKFPFFKKTKAYKILAPIWFNNPLFWFWSSLAIIKTIIKQKIEIIHVHGKYILPGAILARLITRKPVVVTVRDYKFLCPLGLCLTNQGRSCDWDYFLKEEIDFYLSRYESGKNFFFKLFLYPRLILGKLFQGILLGFLKSSDAIIGVSKSLVEIYQKNGIAKEKLLAIYNIPPPAQKKSIKVKKEKIILYVGKLSFGKGTDLLIKAFRKIKEKIPKTRLILIGIKSPSLKYFPSSIEYYGQIPHEKLASYYQRASLFVIPSRWPEPLSRSSLEALSFGLPLIVSNRGGNREVVVDGINGYIVNNFKELFSRILTVLQSSQKQAKMSQQSLEILKNRFNREKIINQHLSLYRKLLNEK